MSYIEIIRNFQKSHIKYNELAIFTHFRNLIKTEYLRYNDDVEYFDSHFEYILNGIEPQNELDYAIDEAIYITLEPLRNNLKIDSLEDILLNWSGYILSGDSSLGEYSFHNHTFDEEDDFDDEWDPDEVKELREYERLVSYYNKAHCTAQLCDKIKRIIPQLIKMDDQDFFTFLAVLAYRFIRIHPFDNGNGRISRMLINYLINLKQDSLPIGLDNEDIISLIWCYKPMSRSLYRILDGEYLKILENDNSNDLTTLKLEKKLAEEAGKFLFNKQLSSRISIGLSSGKK